MDPLININGLRFAYSSGHEALAGVTLRVAAGELLAIVGANGSGKSTLAKVLGGLERADTAVAATVCGHDLLSHEGRLKTRLDVGVLFQDPETQFVGADVEEDLAFGPENLAWPQPRIAERVESLLQEFGLEELRGREPHQLSGGQKQRVALAGVLAVPRRVLVLDEPTAMLDLAGKAEVMQAVRHLNRTGLTIVLVTQEMDEAVGAERVVALESGRVAFDGRPSQLFADHRLVSDLSLGLPLPAALAVELERRGRAIGTPLTLDALVAALARTNARG